MNVKSIRAWLAVMVTLCVAHVAPAQEKQPEKKTEKKPLPFRQEMRAHLDAGRFDKLDELAARFRTKKLKTDDGYWHLNFFYSALTPSSTNSPAEWDQRADQIHKWMAARKDSITARVAWAHWLTAFAWNARGSGYADTVTQQRFAQFEDRLNEARKVLLEAKKLTEKCPEWYSVMQTVALGQGWDKKEYDALFEEAFASSPDYFYFCRQKARFLLPRWYGKEGDWQAFAADIGQKSRAQRGEALYTQICLSMVGYYDKVPFNEIGIDWTRMRRGFYDLTRENPKSEYWIQALALYAVRARDQLAARDAMGKMTAKPQLNIWGTDQYFNQCRAWTFGPPVKPTK